MDTKALIGTITAVVVGVIDLFIALTGVSIDITEKEVLALVTALAGVWVWWKDHPVTPIAKKCNALMRMCKKAIKENDLVLLDKINQLLEETENERK